MSVQNANDIIKNSMTGNRPIQTNNRTSQSNINDFSESEFNHLIEKYQLNEVVVADDRQEAAYFVYLKALTLYFNQKWTEAIELLRLAIFLDDNYVYQTYLGISLACAMQYSQAVTVLSHAITFIQQKQKLYPELEKVINQKQIFTEAISYLCLSLFILQQNDLAFKWLTYINNNNLATSPYFKIQIATIIRQLGQKKQAIDLIRQALPQIEKEPDSTQKTNFLNLSKSVLENSDL